MVLDFAPEKEITTVGSRVKVYSLPAGKVAYLLNIIITNLSTADAKVELYSGDVGDTGEYRILTVKVPAGETIVLDEKDLKGRKAIHSIYVVTDQQPIRLSLGVDLR